MKQVLYLVKVKYNDDIIYMPTFITLHSEHVTWY